MTVRFLKFPETLSTQSLVSACLYNDNAVKIYSFALFFYYVFLHEFSMF